MQAEFPHCIEILCKSVRGSLRIVFHQYINEIFGFWGRCSPKSVGLGVVHKGRPFEKVGDSVGET